MKYSNNSQNQGQLAALPPKIIPRKVAVRNDLEVESLGDAQPKKKEHKWRGTCRKTRPHTWLVGTDNAVCSRCGKTTRKSNVDPTTGNMINPYA